jgi:hypothetical protein
VVIAGVVVMWDRGEEPRSDALIHHIPDPAKKLTEGQEAPAEDPYAALRDLIDADFATSEPAPATLGSSSDVAGFWRVFRDDLTRAGVKPEYVEALTAARGTTEPRSFLGQDPADIAADMITYLNDTHDDVYLVTDEEAAALQRIAEQLIQGAR